MGRKPDEPKLIDYTWKVLSSFPLGKSGKTQVTGPTHIVADDFFCLYEVGSIIIFSLVDKISSANYRVINFAGKKLTIGSGSGWPFEGKGLDGVSVEFADDVGVTGSHLTKILDVVYIKKPGEDVSACMSRFDEIDQVLVSEGGEKIDQKIKNAACNMTVAVYWRIKLKAVALLLPEDGQGTAGGTS